MELPVQLPIPDLKQARRILCVQPHYDDNDLAAGGTLVSLTATGAEVYYLTVTDDLVGVIDKSLSDEEAAASLKADQHNAAAIIGVRKQFWLGFPDAAKYDYYAMRNQIVQYIRLLCPDFLVTCDPWLPYEAHRDHVQTGLAVAEASYLHSMTRLKTDPNVDRAYQPYDIDGVAFYLSKAPNTFIDISESWSHKARAARCYRAQFTPEGIERMVQVLEMLASATGIAQGYAYAESFKVLMPGYLHANPFAWKI